MEMRGSAEAEIPRILRGCLYEIGVSPGINWGVGSARILIFETRLILHNVRVIK